MWYVTIWKLEFPLEQYHQLAPLPNVRHGSSSYEELTLSDLLLNLPTEYDNLKKLAAKMRAQEIARAFYGHETCITSTMVQTAYIAMRLPHSVLIMIQKISCMEDAPFCLHFKRLNSVSTTTVDEFIPIANYHSYWKFMHSHSLRNATVSIRASKVDREVAQLNIIYRGQIVCKNTAFKSATVEAVSSMFKSPQLDLKEGKEFLLFVGNVEWLQERKKVRNNLLCMTFVDDDLSKNAGDDTNVLDCLMESFKVYFSWKFDNLQKENLLQEINLFPATRHRFPSFHLSLQFSFTGVK